MLHFDPAKNVLTFRTEKKKEKEKGGKKGLVFIGQNLDLGRSSQTEPIHSNDDKLHSYTTEVFPKHLLPLQNLFLSLCLLRAQRSYPFGVGVYRCLFCTEISLDSMNTLGKLFTVDGEILQIFAVLHVQMLSTEWHTNFHHYFLQTSPF